VLFEQAAFGDVLKVNGLFVRRTRLFSYVSWQYVWPEGDANAREQ